MKKILFIAGTRPEAIKLAPVYLEARERAGLEPVFCGTGQHEHLLGQALEIFGIKPEVEFGPVGTSAGPGGLAGLAGRLMEQAGAVIERVDPDFVMVQGDTLSAFAGGWGTFLAGRRLLHLEAGLRTGDLTQPFPEEGLRKSLAVVASHHFAPTEGARDNLLREGVKGEDISVVGNTSIDALMRVAAGVAGCGDGGAAAPGRGILVTGHRRENLGGGLERVCEALAVIAREFPEVPITFAVHPNPVVGRTVERILGGLENVRLVGPMDYREFVGAMCVCRFIVSDSGGVQEEAPALGRPVLVTRERTERPEALERGATRLVGTDVERIVGAARELMTDEGAYARMAGAGCPYGDGRAAVRVCDWVERSGA